MKVWVLTFYLASGVLRAWSAEFSSLYPTDLRCESLRNPLGIDVLKPQLSWLVEDNQENARNRWQTAYQILVSSSLNELQHDRGDLWDTGKVRSSQSIHVPYLGRDLESGTRCFWKVRVWDEGKRQSKWSEPAGWSIGLINASDWHAKWIGCDERDPNPNAKVLKGVSWIWFPEGKPGISAPIAARYFRKTMFLPLDRPIQRATLFFTSDDSSIVYVNGSLAGNANNFRMASQIDVTQLLHGGTNLLAARAENLDWSEDPNPAGFIALLRVEFSDGGNLNLATDSSWKSCHSEIAGWKEEDFDESDWLPAQTIAAAGEGPWGEIDLPEDRRLSARMFRKEFSVNKRIKSGTAWVCGLGWFEFQLNGQRVGDQVLSPALSDYSKRVFYRTFDVTTDLPPGTNTIGIILGNGRFYAPRSRTPTDTVSYGFPKLRFQLHLVFEDNTSTDIVSDENWKVTTEGPIRANNEYDGEEFDARREIAGWSSSRFDDSKWLASQLVEAPAGRLAVEMIEPTRVVETIKPREITEPKPGVYVFDFGQNMAGWGRLKVAGPSGAQVSLHYAERLYPDGTANTENLRSAKGMDVYTLNGRGTELYEPRFTYHGFRYVEVRGFPGKPQAASLVARVVHDDLESAGNFECSNDVLDGVYRNVIWTLKSGYRSIPADCANRDERQGWLGDRAEECRGETYVFNIAALYRKWLRDMADAQKESGSIPDICPAYWPICPDDVVWPSASVIIPGMLRQQYGDMQAIQDHYGNMRRWVDYMCGFVTNGIISNDAYKDWCVPPEDPKLILTRDPARKTAKPFLATAYLYYDLRLLAQYARLLGRQTDAKNYEARALILKTAFNRTFLKNDGHQYSNGTQTTSVLPLAFGLVPENKRGRIFDSLVENITRDQKHIGTGMIGGQWLMRVLSNEGRPDLAYCLASQTTYPSWGYMREHGATTIWELWNGDSADMGMNSGNHVMLIGDLVTWLYESLGGIRPDPMEPGFKRTILRCEPVEGLSFVKASHRSPYGTILSDWKKKDSYFQWRVTVPVNTTAIIYIPAKRAEDINEGGKPAIRAEGVSFLKTENRRVVLSLASGNYVFETR